MREKSLAPVMIIVYLFLVATHLYSDEHGGGKFRFAHLLYKTRTGSGKILIREEDRDIVKIFLQPLKDTYLYLLLISPSNNMQVLLPEKTLNLKNQSSEKRFISSNTHWFSDPGRYSLFYIFTQYRLKDMEKNIKDYSRAGSKAEKNNTVKQILSSIRKIRRKIELASNITDLPAPIVGTFNNEKKKGSDDLLQLNFSDEEPPGEESPVPGITKNIIKLLERVAVTIEYNDIYLKEIVIEYYE